MKIMNLNNILVFGISYNELNTSERGRFIESNPEELINNLKLKNKIKGYINLSTCLRVEFYLEVTDNFKEEDILSHFLFSDKLYIKRNSEAINYLFKVCCGYFSIIKGEDQILAQVKNSYIKAFEEKNTTKLLNVIFNKAIELGKKFRTKSLVANNALSLEAISLKVLKNSLKFLEDKKVLILGVGDLAKSILYLLVKEGIKNITITNRTIHKAQVLQETYNVDVISFDKKNEEIGISDIIISATSAPHLVIKKDEIEKYLIKDKEYIFLDLAVPNDIDEEVSTLKKVSLITLDDVWDVYNKNVSKRENLMESYMFLIDDQMENFKKWYSYYEGR